MPPREFKYRVLLVDDDEGLLVTTAAILSHEGYAVETARDGFEALALLREMVPEVVVSDLKMPNMSGFELLAVVRQRFPGIAVIAMSGEFAPSGMPEGVIADVYVAKGTNAHFELLEAVREVLSASPLRAQPAKTTMAPAWLPRSAKGYVVVTCTSCLRSFSRLRSRIEAGALVEDHCVYCDAKVNYRIDSTAGQDSGGSVAEMQTQIQNAHRMIHDSKNMVRDLKKRG